jgi:hypothetical protein
MALAIPARGGPRGSTGPTGSAGPGGRTIWIVDSSVASSAYANGVRYVPLRHSQSDYISFQLVAAATGTFALTFHYAMAGASSASLRLRADRFVLSAGGNPAGSVTTGTAFTVAAANDALDHQLTSSASSDLSFSVTAGDKVYCYLTRLGTDLVNDTHTSDMRVVEVETNIT